MNIYNKKLINIILTIVLVGILSLCIFMMFSTTQTDVVETSAEEMTHAYVNGQVESGYESTYALTGGYAISNETELTNFMNGTITSGTGYLTQNITLSRTNFMQNEHTSSTAFKKELDGCGYTITIIASTSAALTEPVYAPNDGQYAQDSKIFAFGGLFDVAGEGALLKNINFVYAPNSDFYFDQNVGSWGYSMSFGLIFGYMEANSAIDNCSLSINKNVTFKSIGGSTNGMYNTIAMGGYTGTLIASSISNSKVAINADMRSDRYGNKGDGRFGLGGVTGYIAKSGTIYNITLTGNGNLEAVGSTTGSTVSGVGGVVGVNIGGNIFGNVGSASAGTVSGVITSWTGCTYNYSNTNGTFALSGQKYAFFAGQVVGVTESNAVNEIFYTYDINTLRSKVCSYAATFASNNSISVQAAGVGYAVYNGAQATRDDSQAVTVGSVTTYFYNSGITPSRINMNLYKDSSSSYEDVTTYGDNAANASTIEFDGTTRLANPIIRFDCQKLNSYKEGMFIWTADVSEANSAIASENNIYYQKCKTVEDTKNYKQYSSVSNSGSALIPRSGSNINITFNIKLGYAVYTSITQNDAETLALSDKAYDKTGISAPAVYMFSNKERTNGFIGVSGTNEYYNSSIWSVYKNKMYSVRYNLSDVVDSASYEMRVYNNSMTSVYDFVDTTNRYVSFRADSKYYDQNNARWQPTITLKITPKQVNMVWEQKSFDGITYTSPSDLTYCNESINWTASITSGVLSGDSATPIVKYSTNGNIISAADVKNVGTYKVEVTGCSNSNYTYTNGFVTSHTFTISRRVINIQYRNFDSFVYDATVKNISYVVANKNGSTVYDMSTNAQFSTANICVSNLCEAGVVLVEFEDPNKTQYKKAGEFKLVISLAEGEVSNNYELPAVGSSYLTTNISENLADIITVDELDDKIIALTRPVNIKKADVTFVRTDLESPEFNDTYSEFSSSDDTAKLNSDGEFYKYDSTAYAGFNSVDCYVLGIMLANGKYEEISPETSYQRLTGSYLEGYDFDPTDDVSDRKIVDATGVYLATVSIDGVFYSNYNVKEMQLIFSVDNLQATFDVSAKTGLKRTIAYDGLDHADEYVNFATINGLTKGDADRRGIGITGYSFYLGETLNYSEGAITNEKVETIIASGKYIVVVDHNLAVRNSYSYDDSECNFAFEITPVEINITVDSFTKVYGSIDERVLTYTKTSDTDFMADDNVTLVLTSNTTQFSDAGDYEIVVDTVNSLGNISNYNIVIAENKAYKIDKYPVSIRVKNAVTTFSYGSNKTFGDDPFEYLGQNRFFDEDSSNVAVSLSTIASQYSEVGTYAIDVSLVGSKSKNYTISAVNNTLTVIPYVITFTIGNMEITYGDEVPTITVNQDKEFFDVDSITKFTSTIYRQYSSVGEYEISFELQGEKANNYSAVYIPAKITVKPKTVTVTSLVNNTNLVYDSTVKMPIATLSGVLNNDFVHAQFIYNADENVLPINVGHYTAVVSGLDDENYVYEMNEADTIEFDVTTRAVSIDINDASVKYGDSNFTVSGNGFIYGADSLEFTASDMNLGLVTFAVGTIEGFDTTNDPGTYSKKVTVVLGGVNISNYSVTIIGYGDLTIREKSVSEVELVSNSVVYTGSNQISAIIPNTSGTGLSMVVQFNGKPVNVVRESGEYTITLTGDGNNYVGMNSLTFIVEKAPQDISSFTRSNITAKYNKLLFTGFENYTLEYSLNSGKDWLVGSVVTEGITPESRITVMIRAAEGDNFKVSEPVTITVVTGYDPTVINSDIKSIGNFEFDDITLLNTIIENYNKVAEVDLSVVDIAALNAAKQAKANLLAGAKVVVSEAQSTAGKAVGSTSTAQAAVASISVGLVSMLGVALCFKRKKEDTLLK